jgi:metal-responsive CopG/Arc/MetJ family transcriptional regulator
MEIQKKRKRGRPYAGGRDPNVGVRIPKQALAKIDKMAKEQHTTRAAIIRVIVMKHLGFKPEL